MLNKDKERELAYLVSVEKITPMNADRLECAHIGGWHCVVGKGEFEEGDPAVYFEIDSQLPDVPPFSDMEFLRGKHFKVKSQKIRGEVSQGLLVSVKSFGWTVMEDGSILCGKVPRRVDDESRFLTKELGVTYNVKEDNVRKVSSVDKYKRMMARHPKLGRSKIGRMLYKTSFGKKVLYLFFGRKKYLEDSWPVGKFPGVSKTDQERVENMPWVLEKKVPYIRTQKCDGSSGTYILERKGRNKFEFYVCSRNRRIPVSQKEGDNFWRVAEKYRIEEKMKDYLTLRPGCTFVCWQGEVCAPSIQGNPHGLKDIHFYCFHMTDSIKGRYDIREAKRIWDFYEMEVVPIDEKDYYLPDDFEEFKKTADGFYDPSVCEGLTKQAREGYVYYRVDDPTFSFKNVSRKYLLKRGE